MDTKQTNNLVRLFAPTSIAVVGASTDPAKAGHQMLAAISEFPGEVYPINPKADVILGYTAYPTLTAVAKPIDLVIIAIPAKYTLNVVAEAGQVGAGAIMIISGGFGETGSDGQALQDEIIAKCREFDMRLLGPNTSGFTNPQVQLAANFAPGTEHLVAGGLGVISQSGAINLTMSFMACEQHLGIRLAVGLGNAQDVDAADVVEYLATDAQAHCIAMYLEGVSHGRRLYEVLRSTTPQKPVIIFTVDKSDVAEFAASHTGNMMGAYGLKRAALEQAGAVVVDSLEELIDAAVALSRTRLKATLSPGVGLLTGQAGPGMIVLDHLRSQGVRLPELSTKTITALGELLPPMTHISNPVDTGRPNDTFGDVLELMASDPDIDVPVLFALHEPAAVDPVTLIQNYSNQKPLLFGTAEIKNDIVPSIKRIAGMGVPAYSSPGRLANAVSAIVADAQAQYKLTESNHADISRTSLSVSQMLTHEMDEASTKSVLDTFGISTPSRLVCTSHQEAIAALDALETPLVVKVLDPAITHKTASNRTPNESSA